MGHAAAYEVRGFFWRVPGDSEALWYIELAVLFRRCSRGFSHTAAYGVRGFMTLGSRGFLSSILRGGDARPGPVIINIIRAN